MDAELVRRAKEGDEQAFATLAGQVGGQLYAVAHRILRDLDAADDATQAALISIWRDLPQLRDVDRLEAWAYRLLVRACYAEGKRRRRAQGRVAPIESRTDVAGTEAFDSVEDRDQLERGFLRLSVDQRAVVVLHHYVDMPVEDVARTLGVPVGTVRSRLYYAMRTLRSALDADNRPTAEVVAR